MSTAVLSLGANLGDPLRQLAQALRTLAPILTAVSSVYRTPPWGPVQQDDFFNLVALAARDGASASDWLQQCQELERAARRERLVHWGPRTLDVDVVTMTTIRDGRSEPVISDDPAIILPHPRAAERAFVLVPWAEIEPDAVLPGHGPIADLIAGLDTSEIVRVGRAPG